MRSQLPTLELDAVFEAKEELAIAVKNALTETMTGYVLFLVAVTHIYRTWMLVLESIVKLTAFLRFVHVLSASICLHYLLRYGYQILQALITDLDPDQRVKNAMNEINSSKRLKYAVAERAEGDKILQVKSAEAEAEAKYLSGVGVAKQRKAIVDGLRSSIVEFSGNVSGASTKEVMDLLLLTQYFDMIRDVGQAPHCKTTFVPTSRTLGDDVRNSLLQADAAK
jgi:regulator of protease activity HflC (stomatin/prohibitin superfamily)